MSISTALHSAMTGLNAAGRASGVVSENIANSMTIGYARRSLILAAGQNTGVQVVGVQRHADPIVIANRRESEAIYGVADTLAGFHSRYESLVGTATDPYSINTRFADFETSLITAASRPESPQHLDAVVARAGDLVQTLAGAAEGVRNMRSQADRAIGLQVERLNQALAEVQDLNSRIMSTYVRKEGVAGFLDQRQMLLDEINLIVPINVVARDHGQIALYSDGGAILLDGSAATISFVTVNETMPEMTIDNGALSGLEINGISVRTGSRNGALRGGHFVSPISDPG